MRSVPYYNLNGRLGPRDAAPPRSVAGSLRHRSRCKRRSVERAVDVLKSGALGFGAEHPETDQAEQIPRSKIKKGLAEHHKVGRGRRDDVLPFARVKLRSRLRNRWFADLYGAFPVKEFVFGFCRFFVRSGKPFFVPSPAIRFPERAEGVKGPKC